MYDFIASGIKPAQPIQAYLEGGKFATETAQNKEINAVNIAAAKTRNEEAGLKLNDAKKQVEAETVWGQLPRNDAGDLDPKAEQQFKVSYPDYYDTRKKAEAAAFSDHLKNVSTQVTEASKIFANAHTPAEQAAAQKFAQEKFGLTVEHPEMLFAMSQYASDFGKQVDEINQDIQTAAAAGDYTRVAQLKEYAALAGKKEKAQLDLLAAQTAEAKASGAAKMAMANAASDTNIESLVDSIGAYKRSETTALTRQPPNVRREVMARVMEKYPQYDATKFKARNEARSRFLSGEQFRMVVQPAQTAAYHLDALQELGLAIKNGDLQTANRVKALYNIETGSTPEVAFNTIAGVVAGDIAKAVVGSRAGEQDRADIHNQLSLALSNGQLDASLNSYRQSMAGRLVAAKKGWTTAELPPEEFNQMISPSVQPLMQAIEESGKLLPAGQPAGKPATAKAPATKAEYDALPSGSTWTDPKSGKKFRKP